MASNSPSGSTDKADRPRLNIRDVARAGRLYSLAVDRFPGMPLFPGHPPFQVLTYRRGRDRYPAHLDARRAFRRSAPPGCRLSRPRRGGVGR
jgi:hypothetical protein